MAGGGVKRSNLISRDLEKVECFSAGTNRDLMVVELPSIPV